MLSVHKTTVFFFKSTSKHEKQQKGTGTGRQFVLTARTKAIERTGTGRQFPPSLASLSATKFSLQIYMELTDLASLLATVEIEEKSEIFGTSQKSVSLIVNTIQLLRMKSIF